MVLVFVPPNYPPRNMSLVQTYGGGFSHLIVIAQYPLWCQLVVGIIQLVIMFILHLMLLISVVKVVWVLGPPTFPSRNFIVGLIMVFLCYIRVGIIHPWCIPKKTVTLLCNIGVIGIDLALLVMVEVVLVGGLLRFEKNLF